MCRRVSDCGVCPRCLGCRLRGEQRAVAITWTNTIKGQFTDTDIEHMKQITGNALKLDDYDSVKVWAGQIWVQVDNGYMPPGEPWSDTYKSNFQTWMNSGMPE
jgi:hypothetical protein